MYFAFLYLHFQIIQTVKVLMNCGGFLISNLFILDLFMLISTTISWVYTPEDWQETVVSVCSEPQCLGSTRGPGSCTSRPWTSFLPPSTAPSVLEGRMGGGRLHIKGFTEWAIDAYMLCFMENEMVLIIVAILCMNRMQNFNFACKILFSGTNLSRRRSHDFCRRGPDLFSKHHIAKMVSSIILSLHIRVHYPLETSL